MAWVKPEHSNARISKAGDHLIDLSAPPDVLAESLAVINNWRAAHNFPLNSAHVTLRKRARTVDTQALTSQRIKRLAAIELKLRLQPNMALSQMQDIGGCRAVLRSVRGVERVVECYAVLENPAFALLRHTDYIKKPRKSGYRGVHLIWRYCGKVPAYHGLHIEMQIRSQLQHVWATAVETVGTFLQQALKSSLGDEGWQRFFALMASAMAMRERSPLVPDTPTSKKELTDELREMVTKLDVRMKLTGYSTAVELIQKSAKMKGARYFLLELLREEKQIRVTGFKANELESANEQYLEAEKQIAGQLGSQAVLVSVKSVRSLRAAYPSYFLDTDRFLEAIAEAVAE